MDIGYKEKKKS